MIFGSSTLLSDWPLVGIEGHPNASSYLQDTSRHSWGGVRFSCLSHLGVFSVRILAIMGASDRVPTAWLGVPGICTDWPDMAPVLWAKDRRRRRWSERPLMADSGNSMVAPSRRAIDRLASSKPFAIRHFRLPMSKRKRAAGTAARFRFPKR